MRKKLYLGFTGLALASLVGCLRVPAGVSPSTTPLGTRSYTVLGECTGTDTHVDLFGFIPLTGADHTQKAIDNAKAQAKADGLIDVTVESVQKYFILFSTYTIEVHGKAIKFKAE